MNTRRLFARILSAALVLAGCFFVLTACGKEGGKGTPSPTETVQETTTENVTPTATQAPVATATPEPTPSPTPEPTPESQAEAFPERIPLVRETKKTKEEFFALAKEQAAGLLKNGYHETTSYAEPQDWLTFVDEAVFQYDKVERYYDVAPEDDGHMKAQIFYLNGEKISSTYVTDYGEIEDYRGKTIFSPSFVEDDEEGRTIYLQSADSYTYTEYDEDGTEYSAAYETESGLAFLNITQYDEHGNRTALYTYRGSNGKAYPKSKTLFAYVYDDNGNIIRYTVTDYDWSWAKAKTEKEFTYDAVGNVLSGAQTEFGETGNKTVKTEYTYHKDEKGRVVSIQSKKTSSDSDTIEEKERLIFYHDDGSVLWLWNTPVSEETTGQWFYPSEKMAKELERGYFSDWESTGGKMIRYGGLTHILEGNEENCFSWNPDETMWEFNTYNSDGLLVHEVNTTKNGGDYYYEYNAKKQLVRVYGSAGVVGESEIKYTYDSKGNRTAIEKKGRAYVVEGPFTADEYYSDKTAVENIRYSYDNEGKKTTKEYKATVDGKTVGTSKQSFDKDGNTVRLEEHCFFEGKEVWNRIGERIN